MATAVTYNGINYSIPAVNEENWESLSDFLIAIAGATPSGGAVSSNIRVSTAATTAVAVTDYAVLINVASPATVNLPTGVEKQIFVIADASGLAATNSITINRAGVNTILGGTSYVMDRNNQVIALQFTGGNWYRIAETLPNSLTSPTTTVANGLVAYAGTDGKQSIDLGVGSANQILKTDGTTPAFGLVVNDNVDGAAAIAYSKLNLSSSIVNADISGSAAIEYSKLNLTNEIVNADINATAGIDYSKLDLVGSIQNTDISGAAAIAYSKLDLIGQLVNADISASAGIVYSKLDLTDSIVNADINSSAAIAYSKLDLANSIVNADINALAAIARSKIASGSASHVVVNDGAGALSSVAVLPVSQGGTGLSALGSALQVLRVDSLGTSLEFASLAPGTGDVVGPSSSVTNGIVQFASTTGKALKDLGVGSANQVLLTDGTAPSFGSVTNDYIDVNAGIAFSKLASLTDSYLLVGSATNVPTAVAVTGDVTISNTGVTAISSNSIVNSDISPSAGIALTKLNSVTSNRALESNGAGNIQASSVTSTELGYLSGVTSAIQTQIDSKTGIADNETITGTWIFDNLITGSISGNAGTVTNGAYVNAANTFTLAQTISAASNQLVLSSGVNQLTLNSGTSAAARTYTVPDVGASANFVMDAGTQTIAGAKTFTSGLTVDASAHTDFYKATIPGSDTSFSHTLSTTQYSLNADFKPGVTGLFSVNVKPLDNTSAANFRLFRDTNTTGSVTFDLHRGDGTVNVGARIRPDGGDSFLNINGGNVGIGTAYPNALFEVSSATTVTPSTPTEIRISTTADGSGWSTTNPWGRLSFYSADGSSGGAKNHITLDAVSQSSTGGISGLSIKHADAVTGVLTETAFFNHTGAVTLGPSTAAGLTHTINCTATTTGGVDMKTSGSLANSQGLLFRCVENATTMASIGAFKNASESAANGYLTMRTVGGGVYYLWVDSTGDLRISTSAGDIGRAAGTVVGTQT